MKVSKFQVTMNLRLPSILNDGLLFCECQTMTDARKICAFLNADYESKKRDKGGNSE